MNTAFAHIPGSAQRAQYYDPEAENASVSGAHIQQPNQMQSLHIANGWPNAARCRL